MKEKLKVGQKLWLVPNRSPHYAREITIMKVGRKWAISYNVRHRIDAMTWLPDTRSGFYADFSLYESKAQHDEEVALNLSRKLFKSRVNQEIDNCTIDQITAASAALGFEGNK